MMDDCNIDEFFDELCTEILDKKTICVGIREKKFFKEMFGSLISVMPKFLTKLEYVTIIPRLTLDDAMREIAEGNVEDYMTKETFEEVGSNGLVSRFGFPSTPNFKLGMNTVPISTLIRWILEIQKNMPESDKRSHEKITAQMGALYMMHPPSRAIMTANFQKPIHFIVAAAEQGVRNIGDSVRVMKQLNKDIKQNASALAECAANRNFHKFLVQSSNDDNAMDAFLFNGGGGW